MVAGGLLLIATSFVPSVAPPALIAVVIGIAVIPATYAYVLYKRIEGFDS